MLIVKETAGGDSASTVLDASGVETTTAKRTFLVYDDVGEIVSISAVIGDTGLPQIGDLHDSFEYLRISKRDISRNSERNDAWNLTFQYEYMLDEPDSDSLTTQSSNISGQFVDMWRSGAGVPNNMNDPAETDIGGSKIDSGGSPTSAALKQQTFSTSYEHFGSINVGALFASTNTRNSGGWYGFSSGHLLYMGVAFSTKTANSYTRTDNFLYDSFAHLRQKPYDLDGDLNPKLDSNGHAESVRWVQPFPYTMNFGYLGIPW